MTTSEITVTAPQGEWRDRLAAGELPFQRCADCASAIFYPRVLCPACGSDRIGFEASAGIGTVYSTTTVHGRDGDHNVVLVDLDEDFRMMSTVRGIAPEQVTIGLRVRFEVAQHDGAPLAVFVPCEEVSR